MVETRSSLAALDDILGVDGIDGTFVGPSDFSISWTNGKSVDSDLADMMPAMAEIAKKTRAAGKIACTFCTHPGHGDRFRGYGFQRLAGGYDPMYVQRGAQGFLDDMKL